MHHNEIPPDSLAPAAAALANELADIAAQLAELGDGRGRSLAYGSSRSIPARRDTRV